MSGSEIKKRIEKIYSLVDTFNQANKTLKRFKIFNAFTFSCEQVSDSRLAINVINEEGGAFENTMTLLKESDENFIVSDLSDEREFIWLVKTIDRFTKRTDELVTKARELAKPHVGILVYDEFSDSYLLNSTTGSVLLKTKAVVKQISSTKIDLTNVLFNLRIGMTKQEFGDEILGDSVEQIVALIYKMAEDISKLSDRLNNVERIPRVIIEVSQENTKLKIKKHVTDKFDEQDHRGKIVNKTIEEFEIDSIEEIEIAYNSVRVSQELNENMKMLAQQLIARTEPHLFKQNENKKWTLTKEGRDVLDDLQIINFIDSDISSVEINFD